MQRACPQRSPSSTASTTASSATAGLSRAPGAPWRSAPPPLAGRLLRPDFARRTADKAPRKAPAGGALLRRAFCARQIEGGIDQRDMREGLREIAELAPLVRVVFFGEQADIVGQRQ